MLDRLTDADIARGLELAEAADLPYFWHMNGDLCYGEPDDDRHNYSATETKEEYIVDACNHYPAALRELQQLRADVARLTAELDATPPTLEWLRETFGGQPEITTGSTGYETYKWSCGVRYHTAHNRVTGNTGLTLTTRGAVRAHVEAMKGQN